MHSIDLSKTVTKQHNCDRILNKVIKKLGSYNHDNKYVTDNLGMEIQFKVVYYDNDDEDENIKTKVLDILRLLLEHYDANLRNIFDFELVSIYKLPSSKEHAFNFPYTLEYKIKSRVYKICTHLQIFTLNNPFCIQNYFDKLCHLHQEGKLMRSPSNFGNLIATSRAPYVFNWSFDINYDKLRDADKELFIKYFTNVINQINIDRYILYERLIFKFASESNGRQTNMTIYIE